MCRGLIICDLGFDGIVFFCKYWDWDLIVSLNGVWGRKVLENVVWKNLK